MYIYYSEDSISVIWHLIQCNSNDNDNNNNNNSSFVFCFFYIYFSHFFCFICLFQREFQQVHV